jgi:hypothetical protein
MHNDLEIEFEVLDTRDELYAVARSLSEPDEDVSRKASCRTASGDDADPDALRKRIAFASIGVNNEYDCDGEGWHFSCKTEEQRLPDVLFHLFERSSRHRASLFLIKIGHEGEYSEKTVVHGGAILATTVDPHPLTASKPWAPLDIFIPYKTEFETGREVGSLWENWVADMKEGLAQLDAVAPEARPWETFALRRDTKR